MFGLGRAVVPHSMGKLLSCGLTASGPRAGLLAGVIVITVLPGVAQGQRTRAVVPSAGSYGGFGGIRAVGRVGNTSVNQYFGGRRRVGAPAGVGAVPMAGNRVPTTFRRWQPGARDLLEAERTAVIRRAVQVDWLRRLAPGGAARYFGRDFFQARFGPRSAGGRPIAQQMLLEPQRLLNELAFYRPAVRGSVSRGGVRDRLSRRDNAEQPRHTGEVSPAEARHTQADLMASRLDAMRGRLMDQAWSWFEAGEYQRARSAFQSAEMLDHDDPEPRAGALFCLITQGKYSEAAHEMGRIYRRDADRDLFAVDYRVRAWDPTDTDEQGNAIRDDRGWPSMKLDRDLRNLARHVEARLAALQRRLAALRRVPDAAGSDNPRQDREKVAALVAALSYALWHNDVGLSRLEAQQFANRLKGLDPGGPFGGLGELMAQAERAETTGSSE